MGISDFRAMRYRFLVRNNSPRMTSDPCPGALEYRGWMDGVRFSRVCAWKLWNHPRRGLFSFSSFSLLVMEMDILRFCRMGDAEVQYSRSDKALTGQCEM